MSHNIADIRARAAVETDGWSANNGNHPEMPEKQRHVITYFAERFDGRMLATSPATLVERADVRWLCDVHADLLAALAFAASCIKSGEPWTPDCEEVINAAFARAKAGAP